MRSFHRHAQLLVRSIQTYFVIEIHGNGKQRLDVQVRQAKGIANSRRLAYAFKLPTIVITPARPQTFLRGEFFLQSLAGIAQRSSLGEHFWCECGQFGAERTDCRTLGFDENAVFAQSGKRTDIDNTQADLDNLAFLAVWRRSVPTSRFNIDDKNLIQFARHSIFLSPQNCPNKIMSWFTKLTGVDEKSPEQVRRELTVDGDSIVCPAGKQIAFGRLETPKLSDLRDAIVGLDSPPSRSTVCEVVADAVANAARTNKHVVYLTLLGGGVFGNPDQWIMDAIERTFKKYVDHGLDVRIVSYGRSKPAVAELVSRFNAIRPTILPS